MGYQNYANGQKKSHPLEKLNQIELWGERKAAQQELDARRAEVLRGAGLALLLDELCRLNTGNTAIKRKIKCRFKNWGIRFSYLEDEALSRAYWAVSKFLQQYYSKSEAYTPVAERKFLSLFKQHSKLAIFGNFWIGNHQIDAVVPGVSKGRTVGIAYEIDGPCHNEEGKMKKDKAKIDYLIKHFNTPTSSIPNEEVTDQRVKCEAINLSGQKRADSRKLKLWWRKVYIHTLAFAGHRALDPNTLYQIIEDLIGVGPDRLRVLISIAEKKQTNRYNNNIKKRELK